jgi:hypothetical protein
MTMPFGKYAGHPLESIPLSYLSWVLNTCTNASPHLREEIRRILSAEVESSVKQQRALCSPGLVSQWYRALSREFHPDKGGTHEAMKAVNRGRELLLHMMEDAAA